MIRSLITNLNNSELFLKLNDGKILLSLKKLLLIDDHVGTAIAGLHADARKLIDQARVQSQINKLSYDEPISIQSLVVNICDTKQLHTQYGGARPYGVSLLLAGIDDHGPQLYTTDPSGSFWGWKAAAIGKEADVVRDFFSEMSKLISQTIKAENNEKSDFVH